MKRKLPNLKKRMGANPGQHGPHGAEQPAQQNPSMGGEPLIEVKKLAETPEMKAAISKMLAQSTGVQDQHLAARMLDQVGRIQAPWLFGDILEGRQVALDMMYEMKPGTLVEGMLCQQMIGVHFAALSYLYKAAFAGDHSESYLAFTTRLMRLFHEQAEVMARLKGKTVQQKVQVEHIHVHKGGQAIVGAVDSAELKQGEGGADEKQKKTP